MKWLDSRASLKVELRAFAEGEISGMTSQFGMERGKRERRWGLRWGVPGVLSGLVKLGNKGLNSQEG